MLTIGGVIADKKRHHRQPERLFSPSKCLISAWHANCYYPCVRHILIKHSGAKK
jgi:hypothetical protein